MVHHNQKTMEGSFPLWFHCSICKIGNRMALNASCHATIRTIWNKDLTMKKLIATLLAAAALGLAVPASFAQSEAAAPAAQPDPQHDERVQWWRDDAFGMFIHWGIYSVPEGRWKGKEVPALGEWIMHNAAIPLSEYTQLAEQFNPSKFDATAWAKAMKGAGVKYVVITSKHHDGFALFDSKVSPYDMVDSTPYGKDLLVPLAKAVRAEGMRFGVYYSIMDWHHPAFQIDGKYQPTKITAEQREDYLKFMYAQLDELIDKVDPEILWFDGEWTEWYTAEDGRKLLAYLREKRPKMIVNNRVGRSRITHKEEDRVGDYGTPEQEIPADGIPGEDWETCQTMNDTWGFKIDDYNWKSTEELLRELIDVASKGGNYLLNIGPKNDGTIPTMSLELMHGMGAWLKDNGEAVYNTSASPLPTLPTWGRVTTKLGKDGEPTKLYLSVFHWPAPGNIVLPLKNKATKAYALVDRTREVTFQNIDAGIDVKVPPPPGGVTRVADVFVVELEGTPDLIK